MKEDSVDERVFDRNMHWLWKISLIASVVWCGYILLEANSPTCITIRRCAEGSIEGGDFLLSIWPLGLWLSLRWDETLRVFVGKYFQSLLTFALSVIIVLQTMYVHESLAEMYLIELLERDSNGLITNLKDFLMAVTAKFLLTVFFTVGFFIMLKKKHEEYSPWLYVIIVWLFANWYEIVNMNL